MFLRTSRSMGTTEPSPNLPKVSNAEAAVLPAAVTTLILRVVLLSLSSPEVKNVILALVRVAPTSAGLKLLGGAARWLGAALATPAQPNSRAMLAKAAATV